MSDQILGDYRLLQPLGEGAAGEVFLATPLAKKPFANPGAPLALKRYKSDILRQPAQLERIQREFTVGSTVTHPNLVQIYEHSTEPKPFLVMEYVDGITLDRWLEMFHPIPGRVLFKIVDQLVAGLAALHENGIVHRDFKPQNIMLSSTFQAKIMDLGVVRITSSTPITPTDKFIGTIRHSSPEMLFGRDYDARTDLYSLGTVIYNLLYGEQIFAEENQFARLIELVKSQTPNLDRSVGSRDEVRAALLPLVEALLDKTSTNRPTSILEVKNRLDEIRGKLSPLEDVEPLHGYIATALTGLETDAREAIAFASSRIAEEAKEYHLYVYQPRKATDPLLHPDVDPTAVYRLDRKRVVGADVLLVLANQPSHGVGQELEIAASYGKPTLLLMREGARVSRMVTGSFVNFIDEITYRTPEDLVRQLRRSLARTLEGVRASKRQARRGGGLGLGEKIARRRMAAGYASQEELAEAVGVSARVIRAIEEGDYENVGAVMLDNICRVLEITIGELVSDRTTEARSRRPEDRNLRQLEQVAKRLGWSASDYFDLRDDYTKQLAASGESAFISDEQWSARRSALEQRRLREVRTEPSQERLF